MKFILQTTRKIGFSAFILGVCLFSVQSVFAQKTYTGNGDWATAANWSGGTLPGTADDVTIAAGQNVSVTTAATAVCRKLIVNGSTSGGQGKVTINAMATLNVDASAITSLANDAALVLFGGMIDNKGIMTVVGKQNLDAIRFDNPTSGTTLSSTYMGTGTLSCNTAAAVGSGPATSGNNGIAITFAQTSSPGATFTTSSSVTPLYSFTLGAITKTVFYCPKGTAKIDGTGTITIGGPIRSIRVIPVANNDAPNLTIGSGVTMELTTTITTASIGMILLDPSTSLTGTSASMTNKGTLNFTGDISHPIYMTNSNTVANTNNFTNEGTITINGTFANATASVTTGGIGMFGSSTTTGNVFTNSGFINFNTASGGTSTKPLLIASTSTKNLISNTGTITVGTNGTPAIALRLGDTKMTFDNTGTVTVGAGNIAGGGTTNAVFNNNTNGILNLNSGINSTLVIFTNAGGTFNVPITQRVGRLTVNGGTVAIANGATFTVSTLTLTSGNIPLGTGNITIENGGSIIGGSLASHIITNGTGKLTQQVTVAGALFPIGQSAMSYDPVVIKPAATLNFGARVGEQTTVLGTNPMNPALVVNREWDITGTAGTTDLAFTSSALNKDGSATRPAAAVGILGHYNGTIWENFPATYSANSWAIAAYTGSFSPFIAASPGAVLSTELLNIKVKAVNNTNVISWETASEINNKGFDVERQTSTGAWASLGFVKGIGKAATYTFEDKGPLSISYYRLRQIDFDGTETLSKVVSVSQNTKGRISISPNPTSDKVTIQLNQNDVLNQTATLVLSDMTGRQVLTQIITAGAFQLDLSNLAKGMYVVTLQSNNAIYQEKIVRQ